MMGAIERIAGRGRAAGAQRTDRMHEAITCFCDSSESELEKRGGCRSFGIGD